MCRRAGIYMSYIEEIKPAPRTMAEIAFVWFLRLLAFCFIGFTLIYWMRVSGYYQGANWRFDTMSPPWQTASAILSVLMPVSAVGLWSTQSWGQVVWTLSVFTEIIMYAWLSNYFGANPAIVWFHFATIAIYLGFRGWFIYSAKKA